MSFDASLSEWQFLVVGDRATACFDLFRDLLVVVPNDGRHRARDIVRTSTALGAGHLRGSAASGVDLLRGRLLYGNDEIVRRFVEAVEGRRERIRGITGEDGSAVVACLENLLERAGIEPGFAQG